MFLLVPGYQLTRVVPDKIQTAVKWLCVSVCVFMFMGSWIGWVSMVVPGLVELDFYNSATLKMQPKLFCTT